MKRIAAAMAALSCVAPLAGCGGGAAKEAGVVGAGAIRGIDVWTSVEAMFPRKQVVYQENVEANPTKKELAITFQDSPAPFRVGEPEPGQTHPLTFEGAAKNLAEAVGPARDLLEGELTYESVEKLAASTEKVLLHAREAVRALEERDLELKAAEVAARRRSSGAGAAEIWEGANVASEEDEARTLVKHWMPRARLIERNASNLWRSAATHRNSAIRDWSVAFLKSCAEMEESYAGRRRGRRRRPAAAAEAEDGGAPEPGDGRGGQPEGGPREGPVKAATPGDEGQPESGSTPPSGEDGDRKPDAGPPQVGAFLLGVAGGRRSSRPRRRAR